MASRTRRLDIELLPLMAIAAIQRGMGLSQGHARNLPMREGGRIPILMACRAGGIQP